LLHFWFEMRAKKLLERWANQPVFRKYQVADAESGTHWSNKRWRQNDNNSRLPSVAFAFTESFYAKASLHAYFFINSQCQISGKYV